jgi:general L-amino acid transport system permease protein
MASTPLPPAHRPVPFYRNVKILAVLAQIVFVVLVVALFWFLWSNAAEGLRRSNIPLGFDFLSLTAGFQISEGMNFQATDAYAWAFVVGIVNTLRVAVLGIIFATILGALIGIARLSNNWLLRTVATTYVEIFRNTPLLVQLIFWYVAVILKLPRVRDSLGINGLLLLSNRGLAVGWFRASPSYGAWAWWLIGALVAAVAVYVWRRLQLRRADRPGTAWPFALLALVVVAAVGALVVNLTTGTAPLLFDRPVLQGFNFRGGTTLSPEYFALLLGLTLYTAAFISEVVRGGIQSVNKGQREAARALGLTPAQTLRLVIFPQALRVIIPPLTNQYLNLTKNSSLGIAVGYFDLVNISNTIANQSGRSLQVFAIVMAAYLSISIITSLIMNVYNQRIRLVER